MKSCLPKSYTVVHEIAVKYEMADHAKNLTTIMSRGYLRVISTKYKIDLIAKLKIKSVKRQFRVDYDIIQEKQDIRDFG
jgi:transcription elongation factor